MKNKRKIAMLLILCLTVLSGCGEPEKPEPVIVSEGVSVTEQETEEAEKQTSAVSEESEKETPDISEFAAEHTFVSELPEEDLAKPSRVISSLEDYIYALDYLAFYRIGDKIWFEIDPAFAESFFNPYTIHQKAYQMADLADVYGCQMDDSYYSEYGVIGMKYSMSRDIASEAPSVISEAPVLPSFDYVNRERADYPLPIETGEKEEISCENSEQLYYLVMNGYRPVPEPESIAEELYNDAKEVIFTCTDADQSDFQKIKAIYDWLTTEVRYDSETAYSADTYLVKEQAYYLEGVFLNHCAVCDGKAKACALLLNMMGIPCYRSTGVNEGGDHAWNMVQLEGKWYILCSTYGQANLAEDFGYIVPNYSMLLVSAKTPYEWYPAQKHPDIEAQLQTEPYDNFETMGRDDGLNLKISNIEELQALLDIISDRSQPGYKVEFEYTGSDKEAFTEDLTAWLDNIQGANAAEVRSENSPVFQVMIPETAEN